MKLKSHNGNKIKNVNGEVANNLLMIGFEISVMHVMIVYFLYL